MLKPVCGFLRAETADLGQQLRILDLVCEVANTVDEEFFAQRKKHRHRIEPRGSECVATVPVGGKGSFNVKGLSARSEFESIGAVALRHAGHMSDCSPKKTPVRPVS